MKAVCYTAHMEKQKRFVSFRVTDDVYEAIETLKVRDGIPLSEQMRRALQLWLESKGVAPTRKTTKRAAAR